MYNRKRNNKTFTGRYKHKALNLKCVSKRKKHCKCIPTDIYELKSCFVLLYKLTDDNWASNDKKHTGSVSMVNLLSKNDNKHFDTSKNFFLCNGKYERGHESVSIHHDSNRSSCSENKDKSLHKPSDVYSYKKKRYSKNDGSHIKSFCDKKPPSNTTDNKSEKEQKLENAIAMHNIKPCFVVLSRIDYRNYIGRESSKDLFKNESKDVSRDVSNEETNSDLTHAYIKHKNSLMYRIQKNAVQYLNSKTLDVTKGPFSLALLDEDTQTNRFNTPGTKCEDHENEQYVYQNCQNFSSKDNRNFFNDSTPSTSSSSFFDEMGSDWLSSEYIRNKYPEFFQDVSNNSNSDIAKNFLNRIRQLRLSGFISPFNPSDDANKNQSRNLFERNSDNELPPEMENMINLEEDSDEYVDFSQKNKIAYNKVNESFSNDSESEVEEISESINNKSHHEEKSILLPPIKPFISLTGKKYIVEYFHFDNIEKIFVTVCLRDEPYSLRRPISQCTNCEHSVKSILDSSQEYIKCRRNLKHIPEESSRNYTESGKVLGKNPGSPQRYPENEEYLENEPESSRRYQEHKENLENKSESSQEYVKYEQNSENKPTVSEALDLPDTSDRETEKIFSENAIPAINFYNNHNNENLRSVSNRIPSTNECSCGVQDPSRNDQYLNGNQHPLDEDQHSSSDDDQHSSSDDQCPSSADEGIVSSSNSSSEDEHSDSDSDSSSVISVNSDIDNQCVHCFYVFLNKTDEYNHRCPGKREKGFLCKYCERIFKIDEDFKIHSKMHIIDNT